MDNLLKDIRFALRSLLRRPGFTAIALLTLALGIGINAALFSVINGVLLNPLPFPQPEQLVVMDQSKPNFETGAIPYPNFLDLRKENQTFAAMSIFRSAAFSLIGAGEPERVNGRYVSAGFCSVFGITPVIGRGFLPHEDEPGVTPTVLISHELWQRKFAGNPDVITRAITLDDRSYYVIGVLPADFRFFQTGDVFVPIGQLDSPALKRRGAGLGLHGIGRLKPGVTVEQGRADLNRIYQNLALAYPGTNKNNSAYVASLKQRVVGAIGPTLWMLLGAVGFVLLIACVNVGNLMLARTSGRGREFAIRAALGAGWWRLVRQSLTESLVLSLGGGALGLFVAYWATHGALSLLPATLPRSQEVRVDYRVLLFALGISLLSGVLAGLVPALRSSQSRFSNALKESGRGSIGARSRAQAILVAAEVALAVVLLIGAGLMIRSVRALWNIDPGFRSDNLLTFGLSLEPSVRNDKPDAIRANLRQVSDSLNSLPGVSAASFQSGAFPILDEDDTRFWIEGEPKPVIGSDMHSTLVSAVEPTYLTAMGMTLKQGRFFDNHDDEHAPWVVVVDDVFANKFFPNGDAIGKRIHQDDNPQTIIGIVGHVKVWGLDSDDTQPLRAQMYEPLRQFPDNGVSQFATGVRVVLRSTGEPPIESIRSLVKNLNGQNLIYNPQTMNETLAGSLSSRRFAMVLLDSFAILALLMASLGLYGVISYLVERRTQELGIRIALGAQNRTVLGLVLSDGLKMAVSGVAVGLLAAFGLTRLLTGMVYGVSTTDPATFAAITILLIVIAALASYLPARRATKVDPMVALRYE